MFLTVSAMRFVGCCPMLHVRETVVESARQASSPGAWRRRRAKVAASERRRRKAAVSCRPSGGSCRPADRASCGTHCEFYGRRLAPPEGHWGARASRGLSAQGPLRLSGPARRRGERRRGGSPEAPKAGGASEAAAGAGMANRPMYFAQPVTRGGVLRTGGRRRGGGGEG
jgi:hypothetical protein